jgi:hypothetical protein
MASQKMATGSSALQSVEIAAPQADAQPLAIVTRLFFMKKVIFAQSQVAANYRGTSLQEHGCQQRDPAMAGGDALKQTRAVVRFGRAIASTHNGHSPYKIGDTNGGI